ncbi:hypothetical protein [Streptomyces sp. NPDC001020]
MDELTEPAVAGATAPVTWMVSGYRAGTEAAVTKVASRGVQHSTAVQAHTVGDLTFGDTDR